MLVRVNELGTIQKEKVMNVHYLDVDTEDREVARRVAFCYVNKRKHQDYNELAHNTLVLEVQKLGSVEIHVLERVT